MKYIFSIISLLICLKIEFKKISIYRCMKDLNYMPYVCSSLGYVINLSGKKGCGKTTTGAGIVNNLILYLQSELSRRMENIRKSLPKIDFNLFESTYLNNLETFQFNPIFAVKKTLEEYSSDKIFSDYLKIRKVDDMLKEYLEWFYIINFRKRYVLSKTYFFDIPCLQLARQLDPSSLDLNYLHLTRNYQVKKANILFNDENSNGSGNVNSNNKEVKKSGRKEFRSLIRNAYEEVNFEISTKQIDVDEVSGERRQIDANLNIRKRKFINESFLLIKILETIYKLLLFPKKIGWFFKPENEITFKKKMGFFRNFENFIFRCNHLILSDGYIKVYCRNYFRPDDVGKKDPELWDRIVLVFPKKYCYASVDTHEWKDLVEHYEQFSENAINITTSSFDAKQKVEVWLKTMKRGE